MDEDGFIGEYILYFINIIFRGSYAKVVKGREKSTGKPVAIKIIKK